MIRQAQGAEVATVVDVLTGAFTDDPLVGWLFPDPAERGRLQGRFYRYQVTAPGAEAYLTESSTAASLWMATSSSGGEDVDLEATFGEAGARLGALGEALAPRHPEEPHLYLVCMGVVSGRRGGGLGSALLRDRLDRATVPAYLEASSPRSRALYLRHGFEDLGAPVQVADSPPLWPMWRPATKENN